MKATLIKQVDGFTGDARLYKLEPPMKLTNYDDEVTGETEYVVVSGTVAPFSGPETYIFQADQDGKVTNFGELDGSFRGGIDHEAALKGAGYSVVEPEQPQIALEQVESSKIHAIGHDPQTNTLAIQFKRFNGEPGSLYHYANFSEEKFAEFKAAESIGSYFGKNIKPEVEAHPYRRVA